MTDCSRFSADGRPCRNTTTNADGWCRTDGCEGFSRPSAEQAPELKDVKYYGSAEEMAETGNCPAHVRSSPASIAILPKAIRAFKFHHGGTEREAELQIRKMLRDFLDKSARTVTTANYLVLSREGYRLDIGPNRKCVTAYRSAHRDRTWEQVKLGITTRMDSAQRDPMPLLPTLESSSAAAAPPERPSPSSLTRTRPPARRTAESDVSRADRSVQHATASTAPVSAELPSKHSGSNEQRPAGTSSSKNDDSLSDTIAAVGSTAATASPPSPESADIRSQDETGGTRVDRNQASAPAGRRISLPAAAAIALGALLIGRRTGRRR